PPAPHRHTPPYTTLFGTDQVIPVSMDERSDDDSLQSARRARHDARSGRRESTRQKRIDGPDEPQETDEDRESENPQFDTAVVLLERNHVLAAHAVGEVPTRILMSLPPNRVMTLTCRPFFSPASPVSSDQCCCCVF